MHPSLPSVRAGSALLLGSLLVASGVGSLRADEQHAVITSPSGAQLRLEAIDPHIVRVWQIRPGAKFERNVSLAMEAAPKERVALRVADAGGPVLVQTGALDIQVERSSLRFEVSPPPQNSQLGAATTISFEPNGESWTLTRAAAALRKSSLRYPQFTGLPGLHSSD